MLDVNQLQGQLSDFNAYQAREQARQRQRQAVALQALNACHAEWEAVRAAVTDAKPRQLVADMLGAPAECCTAPDRPDAITVVASDGSQIYPDRHIEPTYFLVNVSQIAFHYGTMDAPMMQATPLFKYRTDDLDKLYDDVLATGSPEAVSAIRDEMELDLLFQTAENAKVDGRPLVAIVDGTLIRWMIRGMRNEALEEQLIANYTAILQQFMEKDLPLCSYISLPRNTEVVNLLAFYREHVQAVNALSGDTAPAGLFDVPPDTSSSEDDVPMEGLMDRRVFERLLQPGERSALFSSASHIQRDYPEGNKICYFYVHIPARTGPGEIGRVEMPQWVAEDEALVDQVHSVILDECAKGNGYPMILSEAHERAVIRAAERETFQRMIERAMAGAGIPFGYSRKRRSKQRPTV